jgi:hypothetical protein
MGSDLTLDEHYKRSWEVIELTFLVFLRRVFTYAESRRGILPSYSSDGVVHNYGLRLDHSTS